MAEIYSLEIYINYIFHKFTTAERTDFAGFFFFAWKSDTWHFHYFSTLNIKRRQKGKVTEHGKYCNDNFV